MAAAKKVQKKFDNHVIHGQKLSLRPLHDKNTLLQQQQSSDLTTEEGQAGRNKGGQDEAQPHLRQELRQLLQGQAKRNSRVIVRNLSFKATEADLKVGTCR